MQPVTALLYDVQLEYPNMGEWSSLKQPRKARYEAHRFLQLLDPAFADALLQPIFHLLDTHTHPGRQQFVAMRFLQEFQHGANYQWVGVARR